MAQGQFLNSANQNEPVAVLGAAAAQRLGADHVFPGERISVADVVLRNRHPQPGRADARDRLLGVRRLPRRGDLPRL